MKTKTYLRNVCSICVITILSQIKAEDIYKEIQHSIIIRQTNVSDQVQAPNIKDKSKTIWNLIEEKAMEKCNISKQLRSSYKPYFDLPGRRLSEVKCLENIWDVVQIDLNCDLEDNPIDQIVVGGNDAKPGEFPHMGALGWKSARGSWIFKCGCALISPKYMLTAAHCSRVANTDTTVADPVPRIVRLGETNILDTVDNKHTNDVNISRIINHNMYKSPITYHDIALIELEREVKLTKMIHPSCIWAHESVPIEKATVVGWGVVETATQKTSPILQVATIDVVPSWQCNEMLKSRRNRKWKNGVASHQMCAGHLAGGIDTCQGDSGGPLQMKIEIPKHLLIQWSVHYVVGVTSFGFGCAHANTPGVYTKVSSFLDWIEGIVWKDDISATSNINITTI